MNGLSNGKLASILILLNKHKNWFFSRKIQTTNHPPLFFNENIIPKTTHQKDLEIFLDSKLNFSEHLKTIFQKTNKTIGLLWKLQTLLPRAPLITIYKSFIRPHLDYGDMIYDQTFKMSFIFTFSTSLFLLHVWCYCFFFYLFCLNLFLFCFFLWIFIHAWPLLVLCYCVNV